VLKPGLTTARVSRAASSMQASAQGLTHPHRAAILEASAVSGLNYQTMTDTSALSGTGHLTQEASP